MSVDRADLLAIYKRERETYDIPNTCVDEYQTLAIKYFTELGECPTEWLVTRMSPRLQSLFGGRWITIPEAVMLLTTPWTESVRNLVFLAVRTLYMDMCGLESRRIKPSGVVPWDIKLPIPVNKVEPPKPRKNAARGRPVAKSTEGDSLGFPKSNRQGEYLVTTEHHRATVIVHVPHDMESSIMQILGLMVESAKLPPNILAGDCVIYRRPDGNQVLYTVPQGEGLVGARELTLVRPDMRIHVNRGGPALRLVRTGTHITPEDPNSPLTLLSRIRFIKL